MEYLKSKTRKHAFLLLGMQRIGQLLALFLAVFEYFKPNLKIADLLVMQAC
jgi:hypothetical protein